MLPASLPYGGAPGLLLPLGCSVSEVEQGQLLHGTGLLALARLRRACQGLFMSRAI